MGSNMWVAAAAVVSVLAVISIALFFVSRYRRCPANKVLVISGSTGKNKDGKAVAKCISGGGAFVWPVIQEFGYLDLSPIQLPIKLMDALSFENIRVATPATVTVAIGTDEEHQYNAATRLLGLDQNEIQKIANDIIIGQMRQVIASMKIEEINKDREIFLKNIEKSLEPELKKIGLWLINVNIQDLKDESGYIEATGRKGAATAVQQANADVADQERAGTTKVAEAKQAQAIAIAQADRTKEIGIATALQEKTVAIAQAERTKDIGIAQATQEKAVAVAEAVRTQEIGIATAQQTKAVQVAALDRDQRVKVAEADATASEGEAAALVRKAEAFRISESARAVAEGNVQVARNTAQALAAEADGKRIEAEQRAQKEANAKAQAAATIAEAEGVARQQVIAAEAGAKAIFAKMKAEADGTLAKLEAEAKGALAIANAKADGLRNMVDAAGGDANAAYRLLMIDNVRYVADASAKAISNIKFDKVMVWGNGEGGEVPNFIKGLVKSMVPLMEVINEQTDIKVPGLKAGEPDTKTPKTK